jgi:Protein of unknown function (DUF3618)
MTADNAGGPVDPVAVKSADAPSEAEQEIAADIERTRAELGETVGQLAAKADVGARVRQAAASLRARAERAATELTSRVRRQAAAGTEQVSSKLNRATAAAPSAVRDRARLVSGTTRRYRAQLCAAAVAALALGLAVARRRRR